MLRGVIGGKRQRGNHEESGEDGISRAAQAQGTVTPSMTGAVAKKCLSMSQVFNHDNDPQLGDRQSHFHFTREEPGVWGGGGNSLGSERQLMNSEAAVLHLAHLTPVTDKFTGLDLVDRVPEELRMKVHNILQQVVSKTISKKKMQEGKVVV